jgi:hypothetical protein
MNCPNFRNPRYLVEVETCGSANIAYTKTWDVEAAVAI